MSDLRVLVAATGAEDVRTYIQSGNVIFRATSAVAARLPKLVESGIHDQFGFRIPVIMRTAKQLTTAVDNNPFLAAGIAPETLHVIFLADRPSPDQIAGLDPDRSPPDTFSVHGPDIYLHLPNGVGRSKLTNAYFDTKLATVSTIRNWRTVTTLLAMMKE